MKRLLFFITFMGAFTALMIVVLVREPEPEPPSGVTAPEFTNLMAMSNVAVRQMEGEHLRLELWAKQATIHSKGSQAELRDVRFRIYSRRKGTLLLAGHSGSARLENQPARLEFRDQVVLQKEGGLELRTEHLIFDQGKNLLSTPGGVWIKTPSGIHQGDSLRYSLSDEKLILTRPSFAQ